MLEFLPGDLAYLALLVILFRFAWREAFVYAFFAGVGLLLFVYRREIDARAFTWVKIYSVAAAVLLLNAMPRLRGCGRGRALQAAKTAAYLILAINVLEATVEDFISGFWVNALVGLSLVLTQPRPSRMTIETLPSRARAVVLYPLSALWVATYTAWNFTFIAQYYPLHVTDHLAVLAAPLLAALWERDLRLWFAARAFTLGIYGFSTVAIIELFHWPWLPSGALPDGGYGVLLAATAMLGAANLVHWLRPLMKGIRP